MPRSSQLRLARLRPRRRETRGQTKPYTWSRRGVLQVVRPGNHWLRVLWHFHALEQAEVVKERHQLVGLLMAEPVAAPILDKLELRVDPLAN
eukprot:7382073-Prymnesium_polylepis.1